MIKHAIVDVGIQRQIGWMGKEHYWWKKPHLHYGGHGIGTALVLLPGGIAPALIAGALDWIYASWCYGALVDRNADMRMILKDRLKGVPIFGLSLIHI